MEQYSELNQKVKKGINKTVLGIVLLVLSLPIAAIDLLLSYISGGSLPELAGRFSFLYIFPLIIAVVIYFAGKKKADFWLVFSLCAIVIVGLSSVSSFTTAVKKYIDEEYSVKQVTAFDVITMSIPGGWEEDKVENDFISYSNSQGNKGFNIIKIEKDALTLADFSESYYDTIADYEGVRDMGSIKDVVIDNQPVKECSYHLVEDGLDMDTQLMTFEVDEYIYCISIFFAREYSEADGLEVFDQIKESVRFE